MMVEWSIDEPERQRKILTIWAQRGMARQTGTDVVSFYFWLEQYRSELSSLTFTEMRTRI